MSTVNEGCVCVVDGKPENKKKSDECMKSIYNGKQYADIMPVNCDIIR